MICKKCNTTLPEGTLVCPTCGEKVALTEQEEKIKATKEKANGILTETFSSKLFLVITICLTVISVSSFIGILGPNLLSYMFIEGLIIIFAIILNIIIFVFSLISTIICWKLHNKKVPCNSVNIKKYNRYHKFKFVLEIINAILIGIYGIIILISLIADYTIERGISSFLFTDIIAIFIVAIVMAAIINNIIAYKKIKNYVNTLADTAENKQYKPNKKPPYIRLFVAGGFVIFGAIIMLFLYINNYIYHYLSFVIDGHYGCYPSYYKIIVIIAIVICFAKALTGLAAGIYLIIIAFFFKSIDEKEKALENELAQLQKEYDEIVERTEIEAREIANRQRFFGGQNNQQWNFNNFQKK